MNFHPADLSECILRTHALDKDQLHLLLKAFERKEFKQKQVVIRSGQVSDHLYFVHKGCLSSYYELNDQKVTLWLGMEGDFFTCFKSWFSRTAGHETIEMMSDAELSSIEYNKLQELIAQYPEINHWYRKMLEEGYVYWENRATKLLFNSARERLDDLLRREPKVMARWPLGQIASYLGITQETLSRLRAGK